VTSLHSLKQRLLGAKARILERKRRQIARQVSHLIASHIQDVARVDRTDDQSLHFILGLRDNAGGQKKAIVSLLFLNIIRLARQRRLVYTNRFILFKQYAVGWDGISCLRDMVEGVGIHEPLDRQKREYPPMH